MSTFPNSIVQLFLYALDEDRPVSFSHRLDGIGICGQGWEQNIVPAGPSRLAPLRNENGMRPGSEQVTLEVVTELDTISPRYACVGGSALQLRQLKRLEQKFFVKKILTE